jgi:DNA ligase D-like protein (predicted 3'-phosphoesterase)
MPGKHTIDRARRKGREGKSPTTQAGEFVREEIHHVREGKHGARSPKQAIALGLSATPATPARGRAKSIEKLRRYRGRRDFKRTPEPAGSRKRASRKPRFVVQEHHARALHWDFRLEVGGALASWAVPKGPSLNPADKRVAMRTEDHPLDYADFEGVIPAGEYGAGEVIVWDRGTYRNLTERRGEEVPIERAIEAGHVTVWLDGEKLTGAFALTRIATGKRERWLLVKKADAKADRRRNLVKSRPRSVISGRTAAELA